MQPKMYVVLAMLAGLAACDVSDQDMLEESIELQADGVEADEPRIAAAAEAELAMDDDWSTLNVKAADQPAGAFLTCCVNCEDKWTGWWNRGTGANCSKRAAEWCHDHNWDLLKAEWRYSCSP